MMREKFGQEIKLIIQVIGAYVLKQLSNTL